MVVQLSEYSYTFQHLPGKKKKIADLFCRAWFREENVTDLNSNSNLADSYEVLSIMVNSKNNQMPYKTTI